MRKILGIFVSIAMAVTVVGCSTAGTQQATQAESSSGSSEQTKTNAFASWNEDAASLASLKAYVEDVTDESSSHFIPAEDRIAVFDMDGTLYGELAPIYVDWWMFVHRVYDDPSFEADDAQRDIADQIMEAARTGAIPEDLGARHAVQNARVYAGMTDDEFAQYVKSYVESTDVVGFENLKFADAFYKPMVEVVEYLDDNDFTVYVCSGTDRTECRVLVCNKLPIDETHVIGTDVEYGVASETDVDELTYTYQADDKMVRTGNLLVKNVKANKVSVLEQELGKRPVLSFGNSSGDEGMAGYTLQNSDYQTMAFMVVADDDVRDYGNVEKAEQAMTKWTERGWVPISMKNDFATIYGDDVVRTSRNFADGAMMP